LYFVEKEACFVVSEKMFIPSDHAITKVTASAVQRIETKQQFLLFLQ